MTAAAILGTVASTGLQMYAQNQQAKAVTKAAAYNNQLAQAEAANLESETRENIARAGTEQRSHLSAIRARLAVSGFQTDTGTPSLIPPETAGRFAVQMADSARAASMQAAAMRAKGAFGLWEGKVQSGALKLQSLATGIGGVSKAFSQYQAASYQGAI